MNEVKLKIFFDESNYGKSKAESNNKESNSKLKIDLMGGIAIPNQIYSVKGFDYFNELLKQDKFKLHLTRYSGDSGYRRRIISLMTYLSKYYKLIDINIIYKKNNNPTNLNNIEVKDMMYYKFPERIIYGLLRGYNMHTKVITDIYVEDATEYKREEINLKDNTVRNLKKQAIYRGQNFDISIDRFSYVDCRDRFNGIDIQEKKRILNSREIGVYIIDILLGIVRTILENHYYINSHEELSNNIRYKNELILILL